VKRTTKIATVVLGIALLAAAAHVSAANQALIVEGFAPEEFDYPSHMNHG
jgi:hypothetical protein